MAYPKMHREIMDALARIEAKLDAALATPVLATLEEREAQPIGDYVFEELKKMTRPAETQLEAETGLDFTKTGNRPPTFVETDKTAPAPPLAPPAVPKPQRTLPSAQGGASGRKP